MSNWPVYQFMSNRVVTAFAWGIFFVAIGVMVFLT